MRTPETNHRPEEEEKDQQLARREIRAEKGQDGALTLRIPPGATLTPELLRQLVILQNPGNVVIAAPIQINPRNGRPFAQYTRCGNCLQRMPFTGDPIEDHHIAMRHRVEECVYGPNGGKAAAVVEQHVDLMREHEERQSAIRQLSGAVPGVSQRMIEAGSDRRSKKPWWRRF